MDATDEHMGRIWDRVDEGRVMVDCEHCTLERATARLKARVAELEAVLRRILDDPMTDIRVSLDKEARVMVTEGGNCGSRED